jgi:hypothetical protein
LNSLFLGKKLKGICAVAVETRKWDSDEIVPVIFVKSKNTHNIIAEIHIKYRYNYNALKIINKLIDALEVYIPVPQEI